MQVARRVKDERRIKDGKSKSGDDLDEEQGRGSLGYVSEPAFPIRHETILSRLLVVVDPPFYELPGGWQLAAICDSATVSHL